MKGTPKHLWVSVVIFIQWFGFVYLRPREDEKLPCGPVAFPGMSCEETTCNWITETLTGYKNLYHKFKQTCSPVVPTEPIVDPTRTATAKVTLKQTTHLGSEPSKDVTIDLTQEPPREQNQEPTAEYDPYINNTPIEDPREILTQIPAPELPTQKTISIYASTYSTKHNSKYSIIKSWKLSLKTVKGPRQTHDPTGEPAQKHIKHPLEEPSERTNQNTAPKNHKKSNQKPKTSLKHSIHTLKNTLKHLKHTSKHLNKLINEPIQEPIQEPTKELTQESNQEPIQELTQEPTQEATQEPNLEDTQDHIKEPTQESAQEPTQKSIEESQESIEGSQESKEKSQESQEFTTPLPLILKTTEKPTQNYFVAKPISKHGNSTSTPTTEVLMETPVTTSTDIIIVKSERELRASVKAKSDADKVKAFEKAITNAKFYLFRVA